MPYVVTRLYPAPAQVSIFDILNDVGDTEVHARHVTNGSTMTRFVQYIKPNVMEKFDIDGLVKILEDFNERHKALFEVDRKTLYNEFYIPKKSGGLRKIDAPNEELKAALRELKVIFEGSFGALYHTAAYAYVQGRCAVDAVRRHQANESKWFLKTDFTDFFGSTTPEYTMTALPMIFPFSEVASFNDGRAQLEKAISLAFLDGGLPQGTPLSPLLTNLVCIPIDHKLAQYFSERHMVYTRYADDILVSSKVDFRYSEVVAHINEVIHEFGAPWAIKPQKTRYGSSAGRNWNLGVMLNKDNEITIGHQKKKQFKAMIHNYLNDYKAGVRWDLNDVQTLQGLMSYYLSIERGYITHVIIEENRKQGINLGQVLKADLGSRHSEV